MALQENGGRSPHMHAPRKGHVHWCPGEQTAVRKPGRGSRGGPELPAAGLGLPASGTVRSRCLLPQPPEQRQPPPLICPRVLSARVSGTAPATGGTKGHMVDKEKS